MTAGAADAAKPVSPARATVAESSRTPSQVMRRLEEMLDSSVTSAPALATVGLASRMLHARGGGLLVAPFLDAWLPAMLPRGARAEITHALFDLAYHSQPCTSTRAVAALLKRAHSDARSADAATRSAALKLLGVVLAVSQLPEQGVSLEPALIEPLLHQLREMATNDPAHDVRKLAVTLARTAFLGKPMMTAS